jgi:hypothetical protein
MLIRAPKKADSGEEKAILAMVRGNGSGVAQRLFYHNQEGFEK